jgi:hypothetical protein
LSGKSSSRAAAIPSASRGDGWKPLGIPIIREYAIGMSRLKTQKSRSAL